jgi:hypothetical protein
MRRVRAYARATNSLLKMYIDIEMTIKAVSILNHFTNSFVLGMPQTEGSVRILNR